MAGNSISDSSSNLNLSRRQAVLFQNIILVGNKMAETLDGISQQLSEQKDTKLSRQWSYLMVELAKLLI